MNHPLTRPGGHPLPRRGDDGTRFMVSSLDLSIVHWDHEPEIGRARLSQRATRSGDQNLGALGQTRPTQTQARFMGRAGAASAILGTEENLRVHSFTHGPGRSQREDAYDSQTNSQSLVTAAPTFRIARAFSLIELLVVISIIGILAAIGLPALRGLGGSTGIDAAKRQLLDDLALARLRAMNERTTVYVLFVPPGVTVSNLYNQQLTSYALFTYRSVGDQPGRGRQRFLTEWKHLPENVFIPAYKFNPELANAPNEYDRSFLSTNVLYTTKSVSKPIPFRYLAFNALGQLDTKRGDEVIPVTKGSIFYAPNGTLDPVEMPTSNSMTNFFRYANHFIRINWLTGRARIEKT